MFVDESIARECFKCINGRRYLSLWRVIGNKWGQVSIWVKRLLIQMKCFCKKYFHQNKLHKLNWKTFRARHVCSSKPPKLQRFNHRHRCPERSCARSNAPHKTKDRNCCQIYFLQVNIYWQCHLDDSLRDSSVGLLGRHKICFIAALPLQNMVDRHHIEYRAQENLDEEHELSRGVGGADNSLWVKTTIKPSWPLITWTKIYLVCQTFCFQIQYISLTITTISTSSLSVHGVERNGPSQPLNMVKPFTYFLRLLGSGRVQRPCLALVVSWPPSAALKSRILHQIVHIFTAKLQLFVFFLSTFSFLILSNSSIRSAQSKLSLGSQVLSWWESI